MKSKIFLIVPVFLLFAFISCNEDDSVQEAETQYKSFNKPGDDTIFEIVAGFLPGEFSQLVAAIQYVDRPVAEGGLDAGLLTAIQSNEIQLTVFAPTDAAFVKLLGVLDSVRDEEVEEITDVPVEIVLAVLQYHLTEGRRGSNSVVPRKKNKTIQTFLPGASFQVTKDLEIIDVAELWDPLTKIGAGDPANFANISASNGMIHVIDNVILPLPASDILALWDSLIE